MFSSDAISSVAYATGGKSGGCSLLLQAAPRSNLGIFCFVGDSGLLLSIVAFSYRQTIFAYPNGGGSNIVSGGENFTSALLRVSIAAGALLI